MMMMMMMMIMVDTRCSEAWPLITDDGVTSRLASGEFMGGRDARV